MNLWNVHFVHGCFEYSELFFNVYRMSDFIISSCCFTLFSSDFGVPDDHGESRADYELLHLTVNISF